MRHGNAHCEGLLMSSTDRTNARERVCRSGGLGPGGMPPSLHVDHDRERLFSDRGSQVDATQRIGRLPTRVLRLHVSRNGLSS